jgi:hypothetical protein
MKTLLVTGGPSSGKTEFLERVWEVFDDRVMLVPEAPTYLLRELGWPMPPHDGTPERVWEWQYAIYRQAHVLETVYAKQALVSGAELLICDRGVLDGAAYVDGGMEAFRFHLNIGQVADEMRRYDRGIFLESVARLGQYTREEGNAHRLEDDPSDVVVLCDRTWRVYQDHPDIERLVASSEGTRPKIRRGMQIVRQMLGDAE